MKKAIGHENNQRLDPSHKNDHQEIGGIYYTTLVAMVEGPGLESNGYSFMDVFDDGTIRVTGFRKQAKYDWN